MGASGKKLKSRIRSVNSTMHITKAMELVASSKFRSTEEKLSLGRPYARAIGDVFQRLSDAESPFSVVRDENKILVVMIAGDRGLCGGYNNEVFRYCKNRFASSHAIYLPIGKRACDYCKRVGLEMYESAMSVEHMELITCADYGKKIADDFKAENFDAVYVVYTKFISMLSHEVTEDKLLPLMKEKGTEENKTENEEKKEDILFEPDPESVLASAIPEYIAGRLYGFVAESYTSELSARRTAMDSASKNAGAMIDSLSLQYNRARQGAITQEITEIIGGSEAT